ncbi:hypothetical protein [Marinobacter sp. V034]|uniref:hypothetical protein n=1 Tax=Marinobacter sp. V034 TaxID=3459610 RepID=UPI004043F30C
MTDDQKKEQPPILVARDQWSIPVSSVQRTLADGIKAFVTRIRQSTWLEDSPAQDAEKLKPLSKRRLARWTPPPEWNRELAGFADAIDSWQQRWADTQPVSFLVAPPFTGVQTSLETLCRDRGWKLIEPPESYSIHRAEDAQKWWSQFEGDTPWVLPELAHCWLRTPTGLRLIRRLLGAAASGELGKGIVGSSSWTWKYWSHLMPELRFAVLTPQAYDHARLGQWFRDLSQYQSQTEVHFRLTTNGSWVVTPLDDAHKNGSNKRAQKVSTFLRDLASWSRGIPEVAWAVWRDSLRTEPEDDLDEAVLQDGSDCEGDRTSEKPKAVVNGYQHGWVIPWSQVSLPSLPPGESRPLAFLLHSMLLHGGLDNERLEITTGLSADDVGICLHSLRRAELVTSHARGWFVTPKGYPAIRRYLLSEGFMVDGF